MPINFLKLQLNAKQWKEVTNPTTKYDPENYPYHRAPNGVEVRPPHLDTMMTDRTWGRAAYDWGYRWSSAIGLGHGRNINKLYQIGGRHGGGSPGPNTIADYALHAAKFVHGDKATTSVPTAMTIGQHIGNANTAIDNMHAEALAAINAAVNAPNNNYAGVLAAVQALGTPIGNTIAAALATVDAATPLADRTAAANEVRRIAHLHIAAAVNVYRTNLVAPTPVQDAMVQRGYDEAKFAANATNTTRTAMTIAAPIIIAAQAIITATPNDTALNVNNAITLALGALPADVPANDATRLALTNAAATFMAGPGAAVPPATGAAFLEHMKKEAKKAIQKAAAWPYYSPEIGGVIATAAIDHITAQADPNAPGAPLPPATVDTTNRVVDEATAAAITNIAKRAILNEGQNQAVNAMKRDRSFGDKVSGKFFTRLPGADALIALSVASHAATQPGATVQSILDALSAVCGPDAPWVTTDGRKAYNAAVAASKIIDLNTNLPMTSTRLIVAAVAKFTPKRNITAEAAVEAAALDAETDLHNLLINNTGKAPDGAVLAGAPPANVRAAMNNINALTEIFEMSEGITSVVNNARTAYERGTLGNVDAVQRSITGPQRLLAQRTAAEIQGHVNTVARGSKLGTDYGQKVGAVNVRPSRAPNNPVDPIGLKNAGGEKAPIEAAMRALDYAVKGPLFVLNAIPKTMEWGLRKATSQPVQPTEEPVVDPFVGLTEAQKLDEKLKSLQDFFIKTELEPYIDEDALLLLEQEKARLRKLNPGYSSYIFGGEKSEQDKTLVKHHLSDARKFDIDVMLERYLVKGKVYGLAGLIGNYMSLVPSIAVTHTEAIIGSGHTNHLVKDDPRLAQSIAFGAQLVAAFYIIPKFLSWAQQPMLQYLMIGYQGGVAERDVDLRSTAYIVNHETLEKRDYVDYSTSEIEAAAYDEALDISTPDKALFKELRKIGRDTVQAHQNFQHYLRTPAPAPLAPPAPQNLADAAAEFDALRARSEEWLQRFRKRLAMADTNALGQLLQAYGRSLRNLELTIVPILSWLVPEKTQINPAYVHETHMKALGILAPIVLGLSAVDELLKYGKAYEAISEFTDRRSTNAIKAGYTADHPDPDKRLQTNMGHFNLELTRKEVSGPYKLRFKMLDSMTDLEIRNKQDDLARILSVGSSWWRTPAGMAISTLGDYTWFDFRKITGANVRRYEKLLAKKIGIVPNGDAPRQLGNAANAGPNTVRWFRQQDLEAMPNDAARLAHLQAWEQSEETSHASLDAADMAVLATLKSKAGMSTMTPDMWAKYDAYCQRMAVVAAGVAPNQIRESLANNILNETERNEALDLHRMAQYSLRPWQFKHLEVLEEASKRTPAAAKVRELEQLAQNNVTFTVGPVSELTTYCELLRKQLAVNIGTPTGVVLTGPEVVELHRLEGMIDTNIVVNHAVGTPAAGTVDAAATAAAKNAFRKLASQVATGLNTSEVGEFRRLHRLIGPRKDAMAARAATNMVANPITELEDSVKELRADKLKRLYDFTATSDHSKKLIALSWGDGSFFNGTWKDIRYAWKSGRTRQTQQKIMGPEDAQRHGALNQGPVLIGSSMPLVLARLYGFVEAFGNPLNGPGIAPGTTTTTVPVAWRVGLTAAFGALSLVGNFNYDNLINDKQVKFGVTGRYDREDPEKKPPSNYDNTNLAFSAMTVQVKTWRDFNWGSKAAEIELRRTLRGLNQAARAATAAQQAARPNFVMRGAGWKPDDDHRDGPKVDPVPSKDPNQTQTGRGTGDDFDDDMLDEAAMLKKMKEQLEKLIEQRDRDSTQKTKMPGGFLSEDEQKTNTRIEELQSAISEYERKELVPMQDLGSVHEQTRNWRGIANEFDSVLEEISEKKFVNHLLKTDPESISIVTGSGEPTIPPEELNARRQKFLRENAQDILSETRRQLYFRDLYAQKLAVISFENPETGAPTMESHWELTDNALDMKKDLDRNFNHQFQAAWAAKQFEAFVVASIAEEKNLDLSKMDYAARKELLKDTKAVLRAVQKIADMGLKLQQQMAPVAVAEEKHAEELRKELATLTAEHAKTAEWETFGTLPDKAENNAWLQRQTRIADITKQLSSFNAQMSIEESNELISSTYAETAPSRNTTIVDALIKQMNEKRIVASLDDVKDFVALVQPAGSVVVFMDGNHTLDKQAAEFVDGVMKARGLDDINKRAALLDIRKLTKTAEQMMADAILDETPGQTEKRDVRTLDEDDLSPQEEKPTVSPDDKPLLDEQGKQITLQIVGQRLASQEKQAESQIARLQLLVDVIGPGKPEVEKLLSELSDTQNRAQQAQQSLTRDTLQKDHRTLTELETQSRAVAVRMADVEITALTNAAKGQLQRVGQLENMPAQKENVAQVQQQLDQLGNFHGHLKLVMNNPEAQSDFHKNWDAEVIIQRHNFYTQEKVLDSHDRANVLDQIEASLKEMESLQSRNRRFFQPLLVIANSEEASSIGRALTSYIKQFEEIKAAAIAQPTNGSKWSDIKATHAALQKDWQDSQVVKRLTAMEAGNKEMLTVVIDGEQRQRILSSTDDLLSSVKAIETNVNGAPPTQPAPPLPAPPRLQVVTDQKDTPAKETAPATPATNEKPAKENQTFLFRRSDSDSKKQTKSEPPRLSRLLSSITGSSKAKKKQMSRTSTDDSAASKPKSFKGTFDRALSSLSGRKNTAPPPPKFPRGDEKKYKEQFKAPLPSITLYTKESDGSIPGRALALDKHYLYVVTFDTPDPASPTLQSSPTASSSITSPTSPTPSSLRTTSTSSTSSSLRSSLLPQSGRTSQSSMSSQSELPEQQPKEIIAIPRNRLRYGDGQLKGLIDWHKDRSIGIKAESKKIENGKEQVADRGGPRR